MDLKRPEGFYLAFDGDGNAEMRVKFRREHMAYLNKAMAIIDDILALDEERSPEPDAAAIRATPVSEREEGVDD